MSDKIIQSNEKNKSSYVIPGFLGAAIGAVLRLVAYVKDWLWFWFFLNVIVKVKGARVKQGGSWKWLPFSFLQRILLEFCFTIDIEILS